MFPVGLMSLRVEALENGHQLVADTSNPKSIPFFLSFNGRSFQMAASLDFSGVHGDISLVGTIANQPPRANAGPSQMVECSSPAGAIVELDGSGSTDPDADIDLYAWSRGSLFDPTAIVAEGPQAQLSVATPLGITSYLLSVSDTTFQTGVARTTVTVRDTTPPTLTCPPDQLLECVAGGAIASFEATATDLCSRPNEVALVCVPPSQTRFPAASTLDTCTATDPSGNLSSCAFQVRVQDTLPPVITTKADAHGFCETLWPPDHQYRTFGLTDCVTGAVDQCDGPLSVAQFGRVIRVTSDEPDIAPGDGNTCDDAVITDPTHFMLRAERDGPRDGRVYTIYFGVKDHAGNEAAGSFKIQVPHDQSGTPAIDSGAQYCVGDGCGNIPGSNCK